MSAGRTSDLSKEKNLLNLLIKPDETLHQHLFANLYMLIHNHANKFLDDQSHAGPKIIIDLAGVDMASAMRFYNILLHFPYMRPVNADIFFNPGETYLPLKANPGKSDLNPRDTLEKLGEQLDQIANPNFEKIFGDLYHYRIKRDYPRKKIAKHIVKQVTDTSVESSDALRQPLLKPTVPSTSGVDYKYPAPLGAGGGLDHKSFQNQSLSSGVPVSVPALHLFDVKENVPSINPANLKKEKVHVSLDADLCFLSANFPGSYSALRGAWIFTRYQATKKEADAIPPLEDEWNFAKKANAFLTQFLIAENVDEFHNGSNRQSHFMDKGNSEKRSTCRYFPLLEKYKNYIAQESKKEISFKKDLLCNVFSKTDPLTEYDKENLGSYTIVDKSKVLLYLFQILRIAKEEPHLHHQFKILDDNVSDVHKNFHAFFAIKENRLLLPDNVTVTLYHYDGKKKPEQYEKPIKGEGVILDNYREQIKDLFVRFKQEEFHLKNKSADVKQVQVKNKSADVKDVKHVEAPTKEKILAAIPETIGDASLTFYDCKNELSQKAAKAAVKPLLVEIVRIKTKRVIAEKSPDAIAALREYLRKRRQEENSLCTRIGAFFKGIDLQDKTSAVNKFIVLLQGNTKIGLEGFEREITFTPYEIKVLEDKRLGDIIRSFDPRILPKVYLDALKKENNHDEQIKNQTRSFGLSKGWSF